MDSNKSPIRLDFHTFNLHYSQSARCLCMCDDVLSNRHGIFLETCGARGDNWACSVVLNRSLSTTRHVPAALLLHILFLCSFSHLCLLSLLCTRFLHFFFLTDASNSLLTTNCYRARTKARACTDTPHYTTLSLTYRHWRGASAACIRSLLLKEGCPNSSWQGLGEAREQLSTHTYAHACIPWNMKPYYTFYTQTSATRWRWNTQPHISQKKRFNVFCLCQRFHCSFVHLARSVLRQHATGLCTLVTAQHGQMSIDMRRTKADIITKRCNLSNMLSESIYSHTVYA